MIQAIKQGDINAFANLFIKERDRVVSMVRTLCKQSGEYNPKSFLIISNEFIQLADVYTYLRTMQARSSSAAIKNAVNLLKTHWPEGEAHKLFLSKGTYKGYSVVFSLDSVGFASASSKPFECIFIHPIGIAAQRSRLTEDVFKNILAHEIRHLERPVRSSIGLALGRGDSHGSPISRYIEGNVDTAVPVENSDAYFKFLSGMYKERNTSLNQEEPERLRMYRMNKAWDQAKDAGGPLKKLRAYNDTYRKLKEQMVNYSLVGGSWYSPELIKEVTEKFYNSTDKRQLLKLLFKEIFYAYNDILPIATLKESSHRALTLNDISEMLEAHKTLVCILKKDTPTSFRTKTIRSMYHSGCNFTDISLDLGSGIDKLKLAIDTSSPELYSLTLELDSNDYYFTINPLHEDLDAETTSPSYIKAKVLPIIAQNLKSRRAKQVKGKPEPLSHLIKSGLHKFRFY